MEQLLAKISAGIKADNFMSPDDLSAFERSHLKEAFSLVGTMQEALAQRFQTNRFG